MRRTGKRSPRARCRADVGKAATEQEEEKCTRGSVHRADATAAAAAGPGPRQVGGACSDARFGREPCLDRSMEWNAAATWRRCERLWCRPERSRPRVEWLVGTLGPRILISPCLRQRRACREDEIPNGHSFALSSSRFCPLARDCARTKVSTSRASVAEVRVPHPRPELSSSIARDGNVCTGAAPHPVASHSSHESSTQVTAPRIPCPSTTTNFFLPLSSTVLPSF